MRSGKVKLYIITIGFSLIGLIGCTPTAIEPTWTPETPASEIPADIIDPSINLDITTTPTIEVVENRADLIFHNGMLFTMEDGFPSVEAIAILGDRILAVGNDAEILNLADSETQVIDLDGQTLLPGFADGHSHLFRAPPGMTLDDVQDVALRYGFTSSAEMWADNEHVEHLLQAEEDGLLRLRVNVFPHYNSPRLNDERKREILQNWYPENSPILDSDRMLRIPGIKIYVDGDGTPARGCPARRSPYSELSISSDWFPQSCGTINGDLYWDQTELNQVVADAQAAGYRVAFHAMGTLGIETALNSIEFALAGESNLIYRHQIQHSSSLEPDLIERYVTEKILSSVRGYFNTCSQDFYLTAYEPQPYEWISSRYALPGLGVHAYLETDTTAGGDPTGMYSHFSPNSMVHLFGLVTRKQIQADGTFCSPDPWVAQHTISVDQALYMMTYEPAFAVSQEDVLGTLTPGKYADLVILSNDPHAVAPDELIDLEVWMTMVGGKVAYCKNGHKALCPSWQPSAAAQQLSEDEPTDNPVQPVTIKLYEKELSVPAGTPILLSISWATDTEEQVANFLETAALTGSLDGQLLSGMNDFWSEITAYDSRYGEDQDYLSEWLYSLGVLSPGTHVVEIQCNVDRSVTDGFDSNGDGTPNEYSGEVMNFTVHIIVQN